MGEGVNTRVSFLSFVWMCGIVLFHVGGGNVPWYNELLLDFRVGGVSFFFIVSGYFFVKHFHEHSLFPWWSNELRKRLKTLVVPYMLWCMLGISGTDLLRQFGVVGVSPEANPPLWYVKFLLLFCCFSIVIVPLVHAISRRCRLLLFFAIAILILPWVPVPGKFCVVLSFLMFHLGVALAFCGNPLRSMVPSWPALFALILIWVVLFSCRLTLMPGQERYAWTLNVYSSAVLVLSSWLLASHVKGLEKFSFVFELTFFIYCSHILILRVLGCFACGGILQGCVVIVVCSCVGALLKRYLRPIYVALTGGR